jgi:hypothetical protein
MSGSRGGSSYSTGPALVDMSIYATGGGHSWQTMGAVDGATADTAPVLRDALNVIIDAPTANCGVTLPPAVGGQMLVVSNQAANAVTVFCAPNSQDGVFAGVGIQPVAQASLPSGRTSLLTLVPGVWTGILGVLS